MVNLEIRFLQKAIYASGITAFKSITAINFPLRYQNDK